MRRSILVLAVLSAFMAIAYSEPGKGRPIFSIPRGLHSFCIYFLFQDYWISKKSSLRGSWQNIGKECWRSCGKTPGPCIWCGGKSFGSTSTVQGMCCRQGQRWIGNDCNKSMGGEDQHQCTLLKLSGAQKLPTTWTGML